jgi:uncharacterized protein (TIGR00251 family)
MAAARFLTVHKKTGGILVSVRAKPTGKVNRIISIDGDYVEIELSAKPQNGEANCELIEYLSNFLKIKKNEIKLISGEKNRNKLILIPNFENLEELEKLFELEFT